MHEIGPHSLDELLSGGVYALFLVLARVGTALAFLPGFGDAYVNTKLRLLLSLGISFILLPVLAPVLPAIPHAVGDFLALFAHEVVIGFFIGITGRILLMALDLAGILIATNTGLSAATSFNPALATAGPIVTNFLVMSAVLTLFVTNMHHMLLGALVSSYNVFKVGDALQSEDLSTAIVGLISHMMQLGFQLAAPFVVMGLVFNVGLGLLARLVPQMHVFLIGLPVQNLVGLTILSLIMGVMIQMWMADFQNTFLGIFQ